MKCIIRTLHLDTFAIKFSLFSLLLLIITNCQEKQATEQQEPPLQTIEIKYKDGTLKTLYTINQDSLPDGWRFEYFPSGKQQAQIHYKNGIIAGDYLTFYENGNLEFKCTYAQGMPEGKYAWYYEEGALKQVGWYKKGKKEGVSKYFYLDGNIASVSNWSNDNQIGHDVVYYPGGALRKYAYYDPYGTLLFVKDYDINGNVVNEMGSPLVIEKVNKNGFTQSLEVKLLIAIRPEDFNLLSHLKYKIVELNKKLIFKNEAIALTNDKAIVKEDFSAYPKGKYLLFIELATLENKALNKYHEKLLIFNEDELDYAFQQ